MKKYCCSELKSEIERGDIAWHEHERDSDFDSWAVFDNQGKIIFDMDCCPFCGQELPRKEK